MNENFKKLFLLPSLLLTQAYCLEHRVELNNNTNSEKYSEKIKIFSDSSLNEESIIVEDISPPVLVDLLNLQYILVSFISLSLGTSLIKYYIKFKIYLSFNFYITKINNKLILQKKVFDFLQSLKKAFHSKYQKLYFYSFIS